MIQSMKNAEEVLEFLLSTISLGTYDRKFLLNVQITNVISVKPITSNQAALFKKIVHNYRRQLYNHEQDALILAELPWSLKVIESMDEFTKANLKLIDDTLILRTPYKTTFIQEFRNMQLLKWNSDERFYSGKYGINTLKNTIMLVKKHFGEIVCCDTLTKIVTDVDQYADCIYWDPTLVNRNNILYVMATTEALDKAMGDLQLSTDLPTLAKLTSYGITIDVNMILDLEKQLGNPEPDINKLMFATSFQINHEKADMSSIKPLLDCINCDYVLITNQYVSSMNTSDDMDTLAKQLDIPTDIRTKNTTSQITDRKFNMPVAIRFGKMFHSSDGHSFAAKTINVVDSSPIKLRPYETV